MAAKDWAFGFMPYGDVLRARLYSVITAPVINVMLGDLVRVGGVHTTTPHGYMQSIEDSAVPDGHPLLLGAVLACFDEDMDPVKYIAATEAGNSTIAGYILVADHPDQQFVAREDFVTNALDLSEGSMNVDIISDTICAGNTKTCRSYQMLDSDSAAHGVLQIKLYQPHPNDSALVADDTPGDTGDEGCRYICQINEHFYGDTIVGMA